MFLNALGKRLVEFIKLPILDHIINIDEVPFHRKIRFAKDQQIDRIERPHNHPSSERIVHLIVVEHALDVALRVFRVGGRARRYRIIHGAVCSYALPFFILRAEA